MSNLIEVQPATDVDVADTMEHSIQFELEMSADALNVVAVAVAFAVVEHCVDCSRWKSDQIPLPNRLRLVHHVHSDYRTVKPPI